MKRKIEEMYEDGKKQASCIQDRFKAADLDAVRLFIFFLLVFTVFAHTIGDNENSRFDTTVSIVEYQSLSINQLHNNTGDKALIDGDYYSDKAPLPSLLAIPSYLLVDAVFGGGMDDSYYLESFRRSFNPKMEWGRFAATVSVSSIAGAATAVLLFFICLNLGLTRRKSIVVSLISGAGTLIFPYSTTFHGTMLGTAFLVAAVYLWIGSKLSTIRRNLVIAGLIGLGVSSSYLVAIPGGILLLLISLSQLKKHNSLDSLIDDYRFYLTLGLGLLIGLLPLLGFNYFATGNPMEPTTLHLVQPDGVNETVIAQDRPNEFFTQPLKLASARLIRSLFSPLNGLFIYSPVLLFGLAGLRHLYRSRKNLFWLTAGSFISSTLLLAFISSWLSRAFYGPRYLLPATTLLLIPLAAELKESGRIEKYIIYFSGAISTLFMAASTQPWMGSRWIAIKEEKLIEFGIYQNRLLEYLSGFSSEALQSPILSYLTGASTKFSTVLSSYPQYRFVLGYFDDLIVTYDTRFLAVLIVFSAGLLIFRKHLDETELFKPKLIWLSLLVIALVGFSSSSFYMNNWYDKHPDENVQWGREKPEIYFHSGNTEKRLLRLNAQSPVNQVLHIRFNGETIRNITLKPGSERITEIISPKKGINRLEFETPNCSPVGRFAANNDGRCITIGIRDYELTEMREGHTLGSGWYDKRPEETAQWGKENPEIYLYSHDSGRTLFEFRARTIHEDKSFNLRINGESIRNLTITPKGGLTREIINTKKGLNKIEFGTKVCTPINRNEESEDNRCVSLGIESYNFTDTESKFILDNLEADPRGYREIEEDSRIIVNRDGHISLELDAIASSRTQLTILKDGKILTRSSVDSVPTAIKTGHKDFGDTTDLTFRKECSNCNVYIKDIALKDFRYQSDDLLYRLGRNWYRKAENENLTWSTGNASIFIYNYKNQTVEKELWIRGRTFKEPVKTRFSLNNQTIGMEKVPSTEYRVINISRGRTKRIENKFSFDVRLAPGENRLEINSLEGCDTIGEVVGNNDNRCVIYGFKGLYVLDR